MTKLEYILGVCVCVLVVSFLAYTATAPTYPKSDALHIENATRPPPKSIICVAGPHPNNPEYVQIECEVR